MVTSTAVERIAGIQRALLPDPLPEIPGLNINASYKTFDQAGGDMYALRPLRPKRVRVAVDARPRARPVKFLRLRPLTGPVY